MNDLENPLSPESILVDDHSDCSQSLSSDKDEDTLKMNISNVKSLENNVNKGNNFYVISRPGSMKSWRIRRRSSSQLTDEFQCPICERRLSRRKNLELHMAKLHPAALPPDPGNLMLTYFSFMCKFQLWKTKWFDFKVIRSKIFTHIRSCYTMFGYKITELC